jgi:two-component system sensor histidine kinase YesM
MMRRFFIRRTVQYVKYLLIPIICAFLFFWIVAARQAERTLYTQGETSLEALYSQLELVVNNVCEQQLRMTNDTNMMVALKKILMNDDKTSYSDAIYIRSINTSLRSVVESYDYISSIYLYFDGYDSYFSSEEKTTVLTTVDESWMNVYRGMEESDAGISSLRTITLGEDAGDMEQEQEQVLSIFHRMLIQEGVIVINLNLKNLQKSLDDMSGDAFEGLYLFDAAGNLLTAASQSQVENLFTDHPAGYPEGSWIKLENKRFLVQTKYYDLYQIYLVSLIPMSSWIARLMPLIGMFGLFFLLDCVIAVLISYFTTKRNFNQIEYTLKLFEQAEQGIFPEQEEASPRDEYGVIMNNIVHMFLKTSYLDTQLAEKQYRHKVMELSTLQYQINPHFLFNTLQTVELEARKISGDTTAMTEILHDLSELLKYALANPQQLVTLREELRYLKEYARIQQYRLGDKFLIYYEIDEEWMEAKMLRLLLQPLLENSILHGIRESSRKGYIKIRVHPKDGWMLFSVIDNGVGMTKEEIQELQEKFENENSRNIGLTNVNRRLTLCYGTESRLKILSKAGMGSCIMFKIPIENMK